MLQATGTDPNNTSIASDIENFAVFMRLNGAPGQCAFNSGVDSTGAAQCIALDDPSNPETPHIQNGQSLFHSVGCDLCHSPVLTTGPSSLGTGLDNRQFSPFSDFALHHMGATLADGISQGVAGADEFRTAPLWGIGQRIFLLHDGRTTDLGAAISAHFSDPTVCFTTSSSESFRVGTTTFTPSSTTQTCGSEANGVVTNFNGLTSAEQDDLFKFLRSL